jgi:hypothetical protein
MSAPGYVHLHARVEAIPASGAQLFAFVIAKRRKLAIPKDAVPYFDDLKVGDVGFYVDAAFLEANGLYKPRRAT